MSCAPTLAADYCLATCQLQARRLEAAHAWCIRRYAETLARLRPRVGTTWMEIAGGLAIFTGPSPFTFAIGMAMDRPITPGELDRVEGFFAARGVATAIEVTPFTDASLIELLVGRGYAAREVTTVLFHDLHAAAVTAEPAAGVTLRWAEPEDAAGWIEVLSRCFYVEEPGPERRANMLAMFRVPNSLTALAYVDGEFAGVAGGMLPGCNGVAPLFGSCTLPQFRHRGVHAALLNFRLRRAREAGCAMAIATAMPGSDSERNLQRCGFSVAYEKRTYVK